MQDVNVNRSSKDRSEFFIRPRDFKPNIARLTDGSSISSNCHFVFLKPIGSAARMGNVEMVMSLLACDRMDVNKGMPLLWAALMGHPDAVK
jgi:hypothetical protein